MGLGLSARVAAADTDALCLLLSRLAASRKLSRCRGGGRGTPPHDRKLTVDLNKGAQVSHEGVRTPEPCMDTRPSTMRAAKRRLLEFRVQQLYCSTRQSSSCPPVHSKPAAPAVQIDAQETCFVGRCVRCTVGLQTVCGRVRRSH